MAAKEKKIVPPKLNKFMHPRNPYKTPPSFKKLALDYPEFRSHCSHDISGKVHLDFKNPKALRALTTCLLHQDFGLQVDIPEDRLVPTLPLRLNYLLWLEDLLIMATRRHGSGGGGGGSSGGGGGRTVVGVDIGTGAACVYPLLGAAHFGWCMLATETDSLSYTSALSNVQKNQLTDQVLVKKVEEKAILKGVLDHPDTLRQASALTPSSKTSGGKLKSLSATKSCSPKTKSWGEFCKGNAKEGRNGHKEEETEMKDEEAEEERKEEEAEEERKGREERREEESPRDYVYDFTMTNPPFFSTEDEMDSMAKSKKTRGEPAAAPTGSTQEKVTEGGEVEFIRQMVEESQLLKDKVRVFSTLIGTKAHVREVRRLVDAANPTSSVFTEFCQGRTMRWGAAWTFAAGVSLSQVRSKKEMATNKPIVLLLPRTLMSVYSVLAAWGKIQDWLKALKVKVEVFKSSKYFVSANIKAFKLTWLNQRRRRREKQREHHHHHNGKDTEIEEETSERAKEEEKKRTREEEDELAIGETSKEEEERERKRQRIGTGGEEKPDFGGTEEEEKEERPTNEEMEEEEEDDEDLEEEEEEKEAKQSDKDETKTDPWDIKKPKRGPKCKLRCNLQVKQTGGLISLEAYYLSGSLGKDGMNQLVQYMRNQLTKPPGSL